MTMRCNVRNFVYNIKEFCGQIINNRVQQTLTHGQKCVAISTAHNLEVSKLGVTEEKVSEWRPVKSSLSVRNFIKFPEVLKDNVLLTNQANQHQITGCRFFSSLLLGTYHVHSSLVQNYDPSFLSNNISRNFCTHTQCSVQSRTIQLLQNVPAPTVISCRQKHVRPANTSSRISRLYDMERPLTDTEAAQEFLYGLNSKERELLYTELAQFHGDNADAADNAKPTRQQLKQVTLHQAVPFIGFGFLDNLLMIVAGEYIDITLGMAFGITTMAAAALGNLISDVAGCVSAHYVETLASKIGLKHPHLSPAQVDMRSTKLASNFGKIIGVTIGCLLGMFPLLFFKEDRDKKGQKSEEKDGEVK